VERRDRTSVATFYADHPLTSGSRVELDEATTQHVRVRRLEEGAALRVTNGRGTVADGTLERLTKKTAIVALELVHELPAPPALRLFVPVADRERMLWLAEKCAELAVTQWQPVLFQRSMGVSPRGQGEGFVRKARARMIGALEQSGSAWLPELCDELTLDDALVRADGLDGERLLLERDGPPR
jgi:16S rRNA (uracil1498-N3)-methyltransferase